MEKNAPFAAEGVPSRPSPFRSWGNTSGHAPSWEATSPLCEGTFPFGVNVIHELEVPDVPRGDYVLGFRYDSENTAQVWQQVRELKAHHLSWTQ